MSFVGFDLGNDSCVVAVARQRGADIDVEVVLNDVSKRETPAVVSFEGKRRLFGAAAAASSTRNLRNTVSQIKRLLGRRFSDPELHKDLKSLPFKVTRGYDGYPLVHVTYLGEEEAFTPTQLLGMLLAHLKGIAEKEVNASVQDCCIGVPAYFTNLQKKSVMDAAKIAGLKSVHLLHETAAASLDYSTVQTGMLPANEQVNVAFVDVGHASTQVSIAGLKKGRLNILAHASDPSLGGRDLDEILLRHFAAKFKEQHKIDVYQSPRACFKLRRECQKMKEKLTSNPEASLSIDSLMEDKDVRGSIKREEFEKLSDHLLERLKIPLQTALSDANLSFHKIQSFVLVGGGSRVPAIVRSLTDLFGKEPRRTIIASECVARGCALRCANPGKVPQFENVYGEKIDADLQKDIDREIKMALQDRLVEETEEKKNALEGYVYDMRGKLDEMYQEFVTDSEKEKLIAKLQQVEDWLYEDGVDETKDVYTDKLKEIKEQCDPIEDRYKEEASSKDPKFAHIDGSEKQKVIAKCEEAAEWLEDEKPKQAALPKHATPVLISANLKRKAETLDGFCRPVMTKPRPPLVEPNMLSPSETPAIQTLKAEQQTPTDTNNEKPETQAIQPLDTEQQTPSSVDISWVQVEKQTRPLDEGMQTPADVESPHVNKGLFGMRRVRTTCVPFCGFSLRGMKNFRSSQAKPAERHARAVRRSHPAKRQTAPNVHGLINWARGWVSKCISKR